jgi:hypothetical protein
LEDLNFGILWEISALSASQLCQTSVL